jgi:Xaa-Pro dipeptidase
MKRQDFTMQNELVADVPRFSLAERDRRWARVRAFMRQEQLDAIFVPPNTGLWDQFQANVRYLTGIGGNCAQAAAIFPFEGGVTAITNPDVHARFWLARQDWVDDIRPVTTGWGYTGAAIERLRQLGLEKARIGVTGLADNTRFPEGITSFGIFNRLRDAFPQAVFVNANLVLERSRFVKSEEELSFIRAADVLVERAIDVLCREARPGVPENVVYARMLSSMIEGGGEIPTMILWSAGWPQPPSNQYFPSKRKLGLGDMILTEAEARWGGYIAQNTQPLFIGKAPEDYKRMFALQQETLAACYEKLRPGYTVGDLIRTAAAFSTDEYECHLAMHARGLGDDSPMAVFTARDQLMSDWPIEENATFIVKPIVRTPDNAKRIYWGDTVVVTQDGAKRLGSRPAEIIELH